MIKERYLFGLPRFTTVNKLSTEAHVFKRTDRYTGSRVRDWWPAKLKGCVEKQGDVFPGARNLEKHGCSSLVPRSIVRSSRDPICEGPLRVRWKMATVFDAGVRGKNARGPIAARTRGRRVAPRWRTERKDTRESLSGVRLMAVGQ